MPSQFRATAPSDAAQLAGLAARLLGAAPHDPMFSERHMRWKYWSARTHAPGTRGYVLVRDDRIVAHAGVLPLRCQARGGPLTLLHPFDWMSEPSAIGSGAALLRRLASLGDGLLIVGGSDVTRRMVTPLGFRAFGEVGCYAAVPRPGELPQGCSVRRIEVPTVAELDAAPAPSPWLSAARSPEFLGECLRCEETPMELHVVFMSGARAGCFLLAFAPAQVRIAAFWPSPGQPHAHALLVRAALQAARARGAAEVACMANAPLDREVLTEAGFALTNSVPMFVRAPPSALADDERLSFHMIDGDVAFLHHGAPEPWLSGAAS